MRVGVQQQDDVKAPTKLEMLDAGRQRAGLAAVRIEFQDVGPGRPRNTAVLSLDPSEMMWMFEVSTRREAALMVSSITRASLCAATRMATVSGWTGPFRPGRTDEGRGVPRKVTLPEAGPSPPFPVR